MMKGSVHHVRTSSTAITYILQNDIVCRYTIRGDEEQCVGIQLEDLTDFAGGDLFQAVGPEVDRGDDFVLCHCFSVLVYSSLLLLYVDLGIIEEKEGMMECWFDWCERERACM